MMKGKGYSTKKLSILYRGRNEKQNEKLIKQRKKKTENIKEKRRTGSSIGGCGCGLWLFTIVRGYFLNE